MGATGGIFEIFQNRHIFLKFLFFKNIKKKKAREEAGRVDERERSRTRGPQIARWAVRCARPGLEEEEKKVSLRA